MTPEQIISLLENNQDTNDRNSPARTALFCAKEAIRFYAKVECEGRGDYNWVRATGSHREAVKMYNRYLFISGK